MSQLSQSVAFTLRRRLGILGLYHLGKMLASDVPTLSILCYHSFSKTNVYSVPPETFISQIKALSAFVDFVSADRVLEIAKGATLQRSAVAITIDDGYRDLLQIVSFTEEHKIPITLFVLTKPEQVDRKVLGHPGELLSLAEIKMLDKKGWTIGSHTRTHSDLARLTKSDLEDEIITSKSDLETLLNHHVDFFAYPKGSYTKIAIDLVKQAGYKAAFSVYPGTVEKDSNPYLLPRTIMNQYDDLAADPLLYVKGPQLIGRVFRRFGK